MSTDPIPLAAFWARSSPTPAPGDGSVYVDVCPADTTADPVTPCHGPAAVHLADVVAAAADRPT